MAENITKVYLLDTPLKNDYNHTLYFANKDTQTQYFSGCRNKKYDNFSYQRKDNIIRIPEHIDYLMGYYNYVMYQNTAHANKWYYAFITDMKYINDERTDIYIETDVIQTWMFDYTVKQSFVEREHVAVDNVGNHLVDEGLELGDYIINGMHGDDDENLDVSDHIIMGSTVEPSDYGTVIGSKYGGIYSGVTYFKLPYIDPSVSRDEDDLNIYITDALQRLTDKGKGDAITSVFLAPKFLVDENATYFAPQSETPKTYTYTVPKTYGLDGYTPKNNKLKTFPFCYLLASNGNGGVAEFKYEFFEENLDCDFVIWGVLTPGCSIRMIPAIYKGVQLPETEGLNLGKFPQCNWATDQYTNWLTQNGVNIGTSLVNAGVSAVGGIVAGAKIGGGVPGAIAGGVIGGVSGLTQIANTMNEVNNAQRVPPQTQGNLNCGDVVTASNRNRFTFYNMSITRNYASRIDKYFDTFGYKVNSFKVPEKDHRKYWWFTKTIDVNIDGNMPNNDLNKIRECYNRGITFWKDATNFLNYNLVNETTKY